MKKVVTKYLPLALLVAFCSEIHVYPLNSLLRISVGIIIINIIGLVRKDIKPLYLILLSGGIIFFERMMMNIFFFQWTLEESIAQGMPSLGYYIVFALLFSISDIYKKRENFFRTLIILASIDIISNLLEALIRGDLQYKTFAIVALVGISRSLIAYMVYLVWRRKELFIIKKEHQKRYSQLNLIVANVESELFYLKKSSQDIENVMRKCYDLYYEMDKDDERKESLLDVTKDIHEIKKDYIRVIHGFEDFVEATQSIERLRVSEVFDIIKSNYSKAKTKNQNIPEILFEQDVDPSIEYYLSMFTILNNLIDNSVHACKGKGIIHISYKKKDKMHELIVIDNGCGMNEMTKALIFNPGFTMKYNEITGQSSTGIGLTHVKNTVEKLNGLINVDSIEGSGTKFIIQLPAIEE